MNEDRQTPALLQLDKEIDVALRVRLATGDGAEDADVPRAVSRGHAEDFFTLLSQQIFDAHHSPPRNIE